VRVLKIANRLPRFLEEQVTVIDLAGAYEVLAQRELPVQYLQRSLTEFYSAVLAGLGGILVDAADPRFIDRKCLLCRIEIRHDDGNLLGRTQSCEEPELVVVSLRLAPVLMDSGNDCLGILNAEGVNGGTVFLSDPGALQADCGVMALEMISVSKLKARRSTLIALL